MYIVFFLLHYLLPLPAGAMLVGSLILNSSVPICLYFSAKFSTGLAGMAWLISMKFGKQNRPKP